MACPCCVQCGIKSLADSVSVTFASTFRPWWEGSDPCYSPVSIYLCPWDVQNESFFGAFNAVNNLPGGPLPDPESSPTSGSCNKYDGTHVVDYAGGFAQPAALSNNWCTSAGTLACPPSFAAMWHQWNTCGYEASCGGIRAWHSMTGQQKTKWFIAIIDSVPAGGTFTPPDAFRTQYRVIEAPANLGTAAGRDWFKVRYSYVDNGPGIYSSYNDNFADDRFAHCLAQCPQLELG